MLGSLLDLGWRGHWLRFIASRKPIVLLYHGTPRHGFPGDIDAAQFERHVRLLNEHFDLITPQLLDQRRQRGDRIRVLLTFDDGMKNNFDVAAPILRAYRTPAIFFVCNRHAEHGNHLWFVYLSALERFYPERSLTFRGRRFDMSDALRRQATAETLRRLLLELRPHPSAMYEAIEHELPPLRSFMTDDDIDDHCAGMTAEQIRELSRDPLFTIGAHTVDHPFLSQCDREEALQQIRGNVEWVEHATGGTCDLLAYPSGDYDEMVLRVCSAAGIKSGFSVIPVVKRDAALEIPRVGLYEPSSEVLGFKVQWGNWIRALNLKAG